MPSRLKRFHHSGQTHFITFCCYRRRKLFLSDAGKETFELALERVRRNFQLCVYGYVVMPEHVHLLLSEPDQETLAVAIRAEAQLVSCAGDWLCRRFPGGKRLPNGALRITVTVLLL
jgi:putative transposase